MMCKFLKLLLNFSEPFFGNSVQEKFNAIIYQDTLTYQVFFALSNLKQPLK
jgi:hypothetical protein